MFAFVIFLIWIFLQCFDYFFVIYCDMHQQDAWVHVVYIVYEKFKILWKLPSQSMSIDGIHCPAGPHETVVFITSRYPGLHLKLHECPG